MAADGIRLWQRLTLKNLGESDPGKHSLQCQLKHRHPGKIGMTLQAPTAIRLVDFFLSNLGKRISCQKEQK